MAKDKLLNATVGPQLRTARERVGFTQAALGDLAGLSQQHVAALESGATIPTVATLCRLADALGATWGYTGEQIVFRGPTFGLRVPRRPAAGKTTR